MLHNIVPIWANKIVLQKTVIYMFIKVYQEPDSVCVCVCLRACGWSTHCGLSYAFVDISGNAVLLISSKNYVVFFRQQLMRLYLLICCVKQICLFDTNNMKDI